MIFFNCLVASLLADGLKHRFVLRLMPYRNASKPRLFKPVTRGGQLTLVEHGFSSRRDGAEAFIWLAGKSHIENITAVLKLACEQHLIVLKAW
jgi:hypothetical protein